MLFEREACEIAQDQITAECFYGPVNQLVFKACIDLFNQNAPVDQLSVTELLRQRNQLDSIGGEAHIASLAGEITGAANVEYHCSILKEKLFLRRLRVLGHALKTMVEQEQATGADIAANMVENLYGLLEAGTPHEYRSAKEFIPDAFTELERRYSGKGYTGILTGLSELDLLLEGFMPDKLYIVAGKTSQGKTALALNFALTVARTGYPVGMFSLEMGDTELGMRLLANDSGVSTANVRSADFPPDGWNRISDAAGRLYDLPFYVNDLPGLSIAQIRSKVTRMIREKGIKLLIVDYLQLMTGDGAESRRLEIEAISRGLKLIAKAYHIPVIALSQLSRKADESDTRRPRLSDLRESGSIEQDADVVIFLHEPTDEEKMKAEVGPLPDHGHDPAGNIIPGQRANIREILVRKNRGGKRGFLYSYFHPDRLKFYDLFGEISRPSRSR
jgi:replicative DNA helicase